MVVTYEGVVRESDGNLAIARAIEKLADVLAKGITINHTYYSTPVVGGSNPFYYTPSVGATCGGNAGVTPGGAGNGPNQTNQ